jgi:hypothetical protein
MDGISIPALLRSNCAGIFAVISTRNWLDFSGVRGTRTHVATNERMIQIQLQPEIEVQLADEAQARGLALDHYIETIVRVRSVEQVR